MARMEDTRLPKNVMFGELVGGAGCVGGRKKKEWGVSSGTTSELSSSTSTSGRLEHMTRGNEAGRWNKGRNVSWRNGSLQRKPGMDYGMHSMPKRGGKDQGEPRASGLVLVRSP